MKITKTLMGLSFYIGYSRINNFIHLIFLFDASANWEYRLNFFFY